MLPIVGSLVVIASVLGGFVLSHGQIMALWQPYELLVIGGAAMGGFLIANPMRVVKAVFASAIGVLKGPHYGKKHYLDILALLFELLNTARKSGMMSLESHIEDPKASAIFSKYPLIQKDHHLIEFITDCLRMIVSGNMGPNELEPLLDLELETHHHEAEAAAHALSRVSDSLPGFGIVAAVLGIVITMGSIGGDIAAVGAHVAAALVGTFLGILLAYGFVGPLAVAMEGTAKADAKAFEAVKMGLVASLHGYNPNIAVEFARKTLNSDMRPSFAQLETHLKGQK
ncbi:flagellar motor stator protein MotA [Nevskia sp.]|uniref:flagellar motor stator protein MotA n=1 Tax=Nevskia sp. TaxID=1929292 RepID=UPI0026015C1D|nr:flagellar motor stator protein MotA [Nevskia sp.]